MQSVTITNGHATYKFNVFLHTNTREYVPFVGINITPIKHKNPLRVLTNVRISVTKVSLI